MCAVIGNKQPPISGSPSNVHRVPLASQLSARQWAQSLPSAAITQFFWPVRVGAVMGIASTTDTFARFAIWQGAPPAARKAQSVIFQIPEYSGATEDPMAQVVADLESTSVLPSNQIAGIGLAVPVEESGGAGIYIQRLDSFNYSAYRRDVSGPTDPFGDADSQSSLNSGHVIWMEGIYNTAPANPTDIRLNGVVVPSGTTGLDTVDTTPTITGLFRDVDEELKDGARTVFGIGTADKLNQFRITIRDAVTDAIVQTTLQNATSAMQAARQFSWTPSALASGKYLLHTQVSDMAGAWSGYSVHYFTVVAATVTTAGPPTGKITTATPATFGFTFNSSGAESTSTMRIKLYKGGVAFATSPEIAEVLAPGASGSVTWAETGFAAIPYTGEIEYTAQARYSSGTQLTAWSERFAFTINAPPNKPTNLTPDGQSIGTYPILSATITDPDDTSTSVTPQFELTAKNGFVFTSVTTGLVYVGNDRWEVPTLSSHHTDGFGTYKFRVRATDASGAVGPWSDYAQYNYAAVPNVVVTAVSPLAGGVVTASNPTFNWTVDGTATPTSTQQAKRHVLVYHAGTNDIAYELGFQTETSTQHTIYQTLRQGGYDAVVEIENSAGIIGPSSRFAFTIQFTPPASLLNVNSQPFANPNDYPNQPTGILVTWDESLLASEFFGWYEVARLDESGSFVTLARIPNQQQTSYVDTMPPGNVDTQHVVRQIEKKTTGDEVASLDVTTVTNITIETVVLTDVFTGESVAIRSISPDDLNESLIVDSVDLDTRTSAPTELRGIQEYTRIDVAGHIHHSPEGTPSPFAQTATLRALAKQRVVGIKRISRIVCYRDGEDRRGFGSIQGLTISPRRIKGNADVAFTWSERDFTEGFISEEALS